MAYFRTGGGGGIPAALKSAMNAVLNKKFGTEKDYNPVYWPDDVNLMGKLEEKTVQAAPIASFSDGADDVPTVETIVNVDYTGSLIGDYKLFRFGKNLLDDTQKYVSGNGRYLTFTAQSVERGNSIDYLPAGTYTFKYYPKQGVSALSIQIGTNNPTSSIVQDWTSPIQVSFTLNEPKNNIYIMLFKSSGTWADDDIIGAQLEIGATATDYEEFKGSKFTSTLGRQIYGGFFNTRTGVLTSTKAADGSDLPDPVEYQTLFPLIYNSLSGYNNIFCNTGDVAVTYRSSGTETIIQPTLISKTITENGIYNAADDDADGYSDVTVNVPQNTPLIPQFTETRIADNTAHAATFTLTESYNNYDMVKIVWYESASSSGVLFTTPDILDEIFDVSTRLCINKPKTNMYVCYSRNGLTWTQTNQRTIFVHEIFGVTFTNCTMTVTDLYKRGAVTTSAVAITSQTSLKDFDFFIMSSIHNSDGSETMPSSWFVSYPYDFETAFDSMVEPCVLEEYNRSDETFNMTEFGMTAAAYFMVQGVKLTAV